MTSFWIVAFLASCSFTVATPVHNAHRANFLKPRQAPSCNIGTITNTSNLATYDPACWNQLDIMTYLTNWTANTPKCTATENDEACCSTSEPWSTCFLRLAIGQGSAYDCTEISHTNSPSCPVPSQGGLGLKLNPYLSPNIASQANYVVLNIIMINYFFTAYYTILGEVISNESNTLSSLLTTVPVGTESSNETPSTSLSLENATLSLQNVIAALTLGMAFPGLPAANYARGHSPNPTTSYNTSMTGQTPSYNASIAAPISTSNTTPTVGCTQGSPQEGNPKSWTDAYYQPNGGRHHRRQVQPGCESSLSYPNSTIANQPPDVNGVSSTTLLFTQALQQAPDVAAAIWPSKLNTTDTITTADLPDYLIRGANQDILQSLNAGLELIMNDAGTFIAFAGYGLFSSMILGPIFFNLTLGFTGAIDTYLTSKILKENSISATPGSLTASNPCQTVQCNSSYWSPVTGRLYNYTGGMTTNNFFEQMFDNTELNLPVLFDGAYNCTMAGTEGGPVVSVNPDSSLNVACLSALPMNFPEGSICPQGAVQLNGKCPFGFDS